MLRSRYIFTVFILLLSACAAPTPAPSPTFPAPLLTPSPRPLALHNPNPETLLRVLNYGIGLERDAWNQFDYPTFHGDFLTSPEARSLFDFVQADLDRYYPEGIPGAGAMFTDGALDPNIWFPPRAVWLLAQTAIVERLRAEGLPLTDSVTLALEPFTLLPTSHELDGDPTPEWLVEVTSETYNLRGWIPLDNNEGDGYTLIPNDIQHENLARGQSTTFQLTPDLSGDGLDDWVMHFDGQPLGTQFGELKVYGRVGGSIVLLEKIGIGPEERFEILDFHQLGIYKIRITIPRTYNFECEWEEINWYHWKGKTQDYLTIYETPPETSVCRAAQAFAAPYPSPEATAFLFDAQMLVLPDKAPSVDYSSLLRIHQAMYFASQMDDARAQDSLNRLREIQNSPFATLSAPYWEEADGSPLQFCLQLQRAFIRGEFATTDLAPYFSPAALLKAYGSERVSYADLICPLKRLTIARLQLEVIPASTNPSEYLNSAGYPFIKAVEANLDNDPDPEWLIAQAFDETLIWFLDIQANQWHFSPMIGFSYPIMAFDAFVEARNDQVPPVITLLGTYDRTVPITLFPDCSMQSTSEVRELVAIQRLGDAQIQLLGRTILCNEPLDLASLIREQLTQLFEDKPDEESIPTVSQAFYRWLEETEKLIFISEDLPAVREVLEQAILLVQPINQAELLPHLLFDLGLSYELDGDTEAARAAYLDLITQWPDSPWAWLAEARVGQ